MHANVGTVSIEMQRAVAEVQGKITVAQSCPRNLTVAQEEFINSCKEYAFAKEAFYSFKRGGENVTGPSIRLAEEAARCWGNFEYGQRELSHHDGATEMMAYAWDMQRNAISTQNFTVRHERDTKSGGKALTSHRDIYENNANMGSRRMRSRILAVLPHWFIALGEDECRRTIARGAGNKTIAERTRGMISAFTGLGIGAQQIEAHIGKTLAHVTPEDLADLLGAFQAIKDGVATAAELFPPAAPASAIANAVAAAAAGSSPATGPKAPAKSDSAPSPAAAKAAAAPAPQQAAAAPAAAAPESVF